MNRNKKSTVYRKPIGKRLMGQWITGLYIVNL